MNRRGFLRSAGAVGAASYVAQALGQVFVPNVVLRRSPIAAKPLAKAGAPTGTPFIDLPRGSFGHARVGDEIFILGGHTGQYHCYLPDLFTKQFLAYNVRTKTWRTLGDYPFPVQSPNLVAMGSRLISFGGYCYDRAFHYVDCAIDPQDPRQRTAQEKDTYSARSDDRIFEFNFKADKWEPFGEMPRRRSSGLAFAAGDKIYLIAGWDGTPHRRTDNAGRFHLSIDVLDLQRRSFIPYDTLLAGEPRRALAGASMNGKFVLVAGLTEKFFLAEVAIYDPQSKTFAQAPALAGPRFAPGACYTGKWLVVAGGLDVTKPPPQPMLLDSVVFLDERKGAWVENKIRLEKPSMFVELEPIDENTVLALGAFADATPYPLVQEIRIGA